MLAGRLCSWCRKKFKKNNDIVIWITFALAIGSVIFNTDDLERGLVHFIVRRLAK